MNKAYLAGIIDGEGGITIAKQKVRNSFTLVPRVYITNTNKELIDELEKERFMIYEHKSKRKCWRAFLKEGFNMHKKLSQLLPYLIIKKQHAELLIQFCKERKKFKHYTKSDWDFYNKFKKLNS